MPRGPIRPPTPAPFTRPEPPGSEPGTSPGICHKLLAWNEPTASHGRIIRSITEDDSGSGAWFTVRSRSVRKRHIYIDKYGQEAGSKLYHALQSQAAHAGV